MDEFDRKRLITARTRATEVVDSAEYLFHSSSSTLREMAYFAETHGIKPPRQKA